MTLRDARLALGPQMLGTRAWCWRCSRSSIFGPLANLLLWAFAEKWYFPNKLPQEFGFTFWARVFSPRGNALASLGTSVWIAVLTVVAQPRGRDSRRLRAGAAASCRGAALILLAFLLPQAVPNLPVYVNIARVFYEIGLNGHGHSASCSCTRRTASCWRCGSRRRRSRRSTPRSRRRRATWARRRGRASARSRCRSRRPGLMASAIFVFLESLDEFTGTYFVGVPDVTTLPLLMFNASMGGNYQIASITALLLLVPSIGFMLVVERFLKADVLAMVGR